MAKLRESLKRNIADMLDATTFCSDDFDVQFFNSTGSFDPLLEIKFKHNERFYFQILWEDGVTYEYKLNMCPGGLYDEEEDLFYEFEKAVSQINNWCTNISEEIRVLPQSPEQIEQLKSFIEEQFTENLGEGDEFSVSEINTLQQKFSDLQERVKELEKENLITKNQLKTLLSSISQVSEDVEKYPKSIWKKIATNKLVKAISSIATSPEGRKILSDSLRKLIGLD